MKFKAYARSPEQAESDCLAVVLMSDQSHDWLDQLAEHNTGLKQALQDFDAAAEDSLLLYGIQGLAAQKLLLIGGGDQTDQVLDKLVQALSTQKKCAKIALVFDQLADQSLQLVLKMEQQLYRFDRFKKEKAPKLKRLDLLVAEDQVQTVKQQIKQAKAIARGMKLTRDLGNLPGNICTPSYLARRAKKLAKKYGRIQTEILGQKQMEALGMGALLAVAKGSRQEPKLIIMQYRGAQPDQKPVVLVGKGLTFDAGGISLKPAAQMDEMKFDMCGGATVFGVIKACAELSLPINVVGIVPASENLPDGQANKPGDVLKSMAGITIEVLNTDAEGRLILCDALHYAKRFEPEAVIDIATLTGACIVALGHHLSALLGNDEALMEQIKQAGTKIKDEVWPLPINADYQKQIDSKIADIKNIGGKGAGTITAACFLSRFTEDYRWAHLDIAGTAWKSGESNGATGRPVPLLMQFLIEQAND